MTVQFGKLFFPAVGKLQSKEKARVMDFIAKFTRDPANPGQSLERVNVSSENVWSARITRDLRCILHKDGEVWSLLYADHHDAAYEWAERRRIGRNPRTQRLQVVEVVERVEEILHAVPQRPAEVPGVFEKFDDDYLLSIGLPDDWLATIRNIRDDDQLLVVIDRLPADVAEALLTLATGGIVTPPEPLAPDEPVTAAPEAAYEFFVPESEEDLRAALDEPFARWIAFLHPTQRHLVTRVFKGPAKVSGSAGTGKTVVALHRARHLARQGKRVLLTTYSRTLAENLARNLRLLGATGQDRVTTSTVHGEALRLVRKAIPGARPAGDRMVQEELERLHLAFAADFERSFVQAEWEAVVEAQGIETWQQYRDAQRTGRGSPLGARARKTLWKVFDGVRESLALKGRYTFSGLCNRARHLVEDGSVTPGWDAVLVDEVQDLKPPELQLLRAICASAPGNLMVVGDAGQRIYPGGFSLSSLGIEVRGRATVLRINYRTTEQVRRFADRVIGVAVDDMDAGTEKRGAQSLRAGPEPELRGFSDDEAEAAHAAAVVERWLEEGIPPEAIGVFGRTKSVLERVERTIGATIDTVRLKDDEEPEAEAVRLGTMHRAKGLEFQAVLVAGVTSRLLPHPAALKAAKDPQDREAAEAREQSLLYVAMTRARDHLAVTWAGDPSPYLEPVLALGET